jgi:hypothetical protein
LTKHFRSELFDDSGYVIRKFRHTFGAVIFTFRGNI